MAGGFTPEFMEELKYKCDIVEIIAQYVPLQKKAGVISVVVLSTMKKRRLCASTTAGIIVSVAERAATW